MKKRHVVENNIKKFNKMVQNGEVVFDSPIQRDDKQWNNKQKSKLIRAILIDFSIPPVYSVGIQDDENKKMIYSILDGKQRLTSICEYISGEFALGNIPDIEYEGYEYNIKGKRFDQLPVELQDAIYDYSLPMTYYVYLTDSEIAEMFDMLNSGSPLSRQQKATAHMGMDSARKMNELKKHPFIVINSALPSNRHVKAVDIEAITQCMMVIDKYYALDSFSGKHMDKYSELLREGKDYVFEEIKETFDYLHESLDFFSDKLVLKKTVLPMVVAVGSIAKTADLDKDLFKEWLIEFKYSIENRGKIKINYTDYMGAGSFSKNKVFGRLNGAIRHYELFLNNRMTLVEE